MSSNEKGPGRPKGLPKTGGRQKGTKNKNTKVFSDTLDSLNFSVPQRAVEMFERSTDDNLKFKILQFLAEYKHSKLSPVSIEAEESETESQDENLSSSDILQIITNK